MATKKKKTSIKKNIVSNSKVTKLVPISAKNMKLNTAVVAAAIILVILILFSASKPSTSNNPTSNTSSSSESTSSGSRASGSSTGGGSKNGSTAESTNSGKSNGSGSGISKTSNTSSAPATTGPCASVFTLAEAQTVFGSSAAAASGNGISTQTADVTTITCTYNSGSDSATVKEVAYNDNNGKNANEVEFGSSRPANTQNVKNFGQSAFWYNGQLNILLNNNWYAVTYNKSGSVTLSNSETIASAAKLQGTY